MKHIPQVGERISLYTPCSDMWVAEVRYPYTVESVNGNTMIVREARPVFLGPRYYDTLPDYIEDDPDGKRKKMRWSEKKQRWKESPIEGGYPMVAIFGGW